MKKIAIFLFSVLCGAMCAQTSTPLKIVYDNDVHGSLEGYAKIAGLRDSLMNDGAPVLTVSAGDFLQGSAYGSMSRGRFCIDMMNTLPYDVVAIGNHDLDFQGSRLMELKDTLNSHTRMVCANLYDSLNQRCLDSYVICEAGGYKVAFVGVLTTAAERLEAYAFFDDKGNRIYSLCKDSLYEVMQRAVDEARRCHPDFVIVLSHLGTIPQEEDPTSVDLIANLSGVDAVIDGHCHSIIKGEQHPDKEGTYVLLTETGSNFSNVGVMTLERGQAPVSELLDTKTLPSNAAVAAVYDSVLNCAKPILGKQVGYTGFDLTINDSTGKRAVRIQETNMGDLVADAYRVMLKTDIGWSNGGGVRASIPAGSITYGDLVNVTPFSNFMCIAHVTGRQVLDALEECYHSCPKELGAFAQISGLRCKIDTTIHNELQFSDDNILTVVGERRVHHVEIYKDGQWQPIDARALYTLGSSLFCVYKGETKALCPAIILKDMVMTDMECFCGYITDTLGGVIPDEYRTTQGRILFESVSTSLVRCMRNSPIKCRKMMQNGVLMIDTSMGTYTSLGLFRSHRY